jgi:hypothetical protein
MCSAIFALAETEMASLSNVIPALYSPTRRKSEAKNQRYDNAYQSKSPRKKKIDNLYVVLAGPISSRRKPTFCFGKSAHRNSSLRLLSPTDLMP